MRILQGLALCLLVAMVTGQEECPADSGPCPENPEAIKKTTLASDTQHYYIGGLFGVHQAGETAYKCSDVFRTRGVMNLQAFLWAINHFVSLLPGDRGAVSVGGVAFDNCLRKEQTIGNIMGFEQCRSRITGVDRRQLLAFVGPDTSSEALAAAELVKDMEITIVSHAATSPELSDGSKYRYFLRTVPSDANDAAILAEVLDETLDAKYTQLIYTDNDYGRAGMIAFKKLAEEKDMCIIQQIAVNPDTVSSGASSEVVTKLRQVPNVKYVVVFAPGEVANKILRSVYAYNEQARVNLDFIFLGTSSWGNSMSVVSGGVGAANNSIVASLAVDPAYAADVDAFKQYWNNLKPNDQGTDIENSYLEKFWENRFGCTIGGTGSGACDLSTQSLSDIELDVYVPYTIMAVHAVIRGIYQASSDVCGKYNLCSKLLNIANRGTWLFNGIKSVQRNDRFLFDQIVVNNSTYATGDPSSSGTRGFTKYEVYSFAQDKYVKYADYAPGVGLTPVTDLKMQYYRDKSICTYPCTLCGEIATTTPATTAMTTQLAVTTPKDPTEGGNFTFVKFPTNQELTGAYFNSPRSSEMWMTRFEIGQKWIIALGVLAGLGIVAVLIFEIYILYKLLGTRMGSRWRTMWLGQLLLFGIFLSFLTLFAFIPTPTKATCGITRFGVGVSYSIMFAVLLVKLMVILTSKTSETSLLPGDIESPNYLKGIYQFLMFMFAVGVQIVIDAQWLITVPPEAVLVKDNSGLNDVWICNHYTWRVSDGMHNMTSFVRNEFENHLLSLVYIMFLILITTVLALNAHGIITNHRESIFIGIASGFSIPLWLAWGLVGGLNRDNMFAQEFGDACIAFGLFLTATLILFAMFLPKVRQLVNIGVEGIYFEDDRETYYAGSVIMSPPSYKSKANSVLYVNNPGLYSEPVLLNNGADPMATHLKHPGQHPGPMSTYSAPPNFMKKGESGKVLRVTPDLTGKHPTERRRPQSEYAYTPRSVKGTLKRSRSQQNLGAL